ncbi:hypothetical protein [Aromatoleum aromaticum]|uniref:hypothetical protein n=1 Tax=Aromatoleum aromaticum TaxID=551760 RepID=UPI001F528BCD|nr:hypothetical protein [Aromatoleum aromaticum]
MSIVLVAPAGLALASGTAAIESDTPETPAPATAGSGTGVLTLAALLAAGQQYLAAPVAAARHPLPGDFPAQPSRASS